MEVASVWTYDAANHYATDVVVVGSELFDTLYAAGEPRRDKIGEAMGVRTLNVPVRLQKPASDSSAKVLIFDLPGEDFRRSFSESLNGKASSQSSASDRSIQRLSKDSSEVTPPNRQRACEGILKKVRSAIVVLMFLSGVVAFFWKLHGAEAELAADKDRMKKWGIVRVQSSPLYDQGLLLKTASDYTDESIVRFDACTWFARPMWGLSPKNPNWFFYSEKMDGVHLTCDINGFESSGSSIEYAFEWDVTSGGAVSSFKVRLSDLFDGV